MGELSTYRLLEIRRQLDNCRAQLHGARVFHAGRSPAVRALYWAHVDAARIYLARARRMMRR